MVEKKFNSEISNLLKEKLARKVMPSLEMLLLQAETGNRSTKKEKHLPLKAQSNLTFLREFISPILYDLRNYTSDLKTDFGLRPAFDPKSECQPEFIIYDGVKTILCSVVGDEKDDLVFSKEIKTVQDLNEWGKENKQSIIIFGKLSKRDIILNIVSAVGSLIPEEVVESSSNPEPKLNSGSVSKRSLSDSMKTVFGIKKNRDKV
jgi:hypothetical protein